MPARRASASIAAAAASCVAYGSRPRTARVAVIAFRARSKTREPSTDSSPCSRSSFWYSPTASASSLRMRRTRASWIEASTIAETSAA